MNASSSLQIKFTRGKSATHFPLIGQPPGPTEHPRRGGRHILAASASPASRRQARCEREGCGYAWEFVSSAFDGYPPSPDCTSKVPWFWRLSLDLVNQTTDPPFRFIPLDHDGKRRSVDCYFAELEASSAEV